MRRPSPYLLVLPLLGFVLSAPGAGAQVPPDGVPPGPSAVPEPPSPPPAAAPPAPLAAPALAPTTLGRPLIDVRMPEPPPPVQRSAHMHEGFYFRGDLGPLLAHTSVTSESLAHPSYSVGGAGLGLDLMLGGSPSVGTAVGGALSLQSFGQAAGSSSAGLGLVGVFVNGFPQPNQGFHLGGFLGLAASSTRRPGKVDELRGGGLGMAVWIGEDWWIADEWSMGGLLRFTGAFDSDRAHAHGADAYVQSSATFGLGLLFSVLYH